MSLGISAGVNNFIQGYNWADGIKRQRADDEKTAEEERNRKAGEAVLNFLDMGDYDMAASLFKTQVDRERPDLANNSFAWDASVGEFAIGNPTTGARQTWAPDKFRRFVQNETYGRERATAMRGQQAATRRDELLTQQAEIEAPFYAERALMNLEAERNNLKILQAEAGTAEERNDLALAGARLEQQMRAIEAAYAPAVAAANLGQVYANTRVTNAGAASTEAANRFNALTEDFRLQLAEMGVRESALGLQAQGMQNQAAALELAALEEFGMKLAEQEYLSALNANSPQGMSLDAQWDMTREKADLWNGSDVQSQIMAEVADYDARYNVAGGNDRKKMDQRDALAPAQRESTLKLAEQIYYVSGNVMAPAEALELSKALREDNLNPEVNPMMPINFDSGTAVLTTSNNKAVEVPIELLREHGLNIPRSADEFGTMRAEAERQRATEAFDALLATDAPLAPQDTSQPLPPRSERVADRNTRRRELLQNPTPAAADEQVDLSLLSPQERRIYSRTGQLPLDYQTRASGTGLTQ